VIAAVVFAMPAEFAPWRRRHDFRSVAEGGWSAFEAKIGATPVLVTTSGIGARNAGSLMRAIRERGADFVVVTGLAGGLKPQHAAGEILVARQVLSAHHDRVIPANERLVMLAAHVGAAVVEGFISVDRIAARAEEKARLGHQGDAVDMESFAVLSEARAHNTPAVAVRVVGDTVNEDLPIDFMRAIGPDGAVHVSGVLREILSRPTHWPAIVRFGLSNRRSLTRLAAFLDRFVAAIDGGEALEIS
jgi:nucleoside phosphorylase